MRQLTAFRRGEAAGGDQGVGAPRHPLLLTVDEAAELLRTTRKAVYAMVERRQLPGVLRIRRRVLFRAADLLNWLDQKCAPSPKE
jgi:excisionase family DNA binding protein